MAGGGALNLSLLSRGVGEVQTNGHEKVEVFLEPEDYYNFRDVPHRYYFPPIKHKYTMLQDMPDLSSRESRDHQEIHLPKTFTTRKGALLLFSEDLALRDSERDQTEQQQTKPVSKSTDGALDLRTVDDLAKSILSYGNHDNNSVYLKFLHRKREKHYRQIRPGFSAKRYLATWTKSWDDSVLETVINKGYITERSLFQYNFVIPHLKRRIFHEDLSHYPPPYRLMRNMLISPGSLSGYTFYRAVPELEDMMDQYQDRELEGESMRSRPPTSIKVIRTRNGEQREVSYASLDRKSQEEVITDLLVKSAVHYALKKQQEYMTEDIDLMEVANADIHASTYADSERKVSSSMKTPVPQFDMKEAVESLLDSHRQQQLEVDFPAIDNQSHSSDYGGSFKGSNIPTHAVKGHSAQNRSWPYGIDEAGKEYIGSAPIVSLRESSSSPSGSVTSIPQLPAISRHPLTPIKDVSRETTYQNITLPPIFGQDGVPLVNVEPPTPQHSTLMNTTETDGRAVPPKPSKDGEDDSWRGAERQHHRKRQKKASQAGSDRGPMAAGGANLHSSSESIAHSGVQSIPSKQRPHWKGSQQSLKSVGSKKGRVDFDKKSSTSSPDRSETGSVIGDGSLKGSIICAPDGEIISVGGSVGPSKHAHGDVAPLQDVMRVNKRVGDGEVAESIPSDTDEPEEWKESRKKVHLDGKEERRQSRKDSESGRELDASASIHQWNYASSDQGRSLAPRAQPLTARHVDAESSASEQLLVDALTEHAQKIAQSVLSQSEAGHNLEADIRQAATLWADRHPTRDISRSQSVQEPTNTDAIEQIMKKHRTTSADPTAAEYREEIRRNLTTAVAKAAGLTPDAFPADAGISDELLEALANNSVSPEDIEIVKDEESGQSTLRSKSQLSKAMGGVKEGHLFVSPGGDDDSKPSISIPSERVSVKDVGDVDVISYGVPETGDLIEPDRRSKGSSKHSSIVDGGSETRSVRKPSDVPAADDFMQAVKQIEEKVAEVVSPAVIPKPTPEDATSEHGSTKTGVSKTSQKTDDSKSAKKKKPVSIEDREEFVVGKVEDKKELEKLYGPVDPPPPPKPSPPKMQGKKEPEVVTPPEPPKLEQESPQEVPTKLDIPPDPPKPKEPVPQPKNDSPPQKQDPPLPPKPKPKPKPKKEKAAPSPQPAPPPPKVEKPNAKKQLPPIREPEPKKEPQTTKQEPKKVDESKGKPKPKPKAEKPPPPKKEEKKKKEKKTKVKKEKVEKPLPPKVPTPVPVEAPRPQTPKRESPEPEESIAPSPDNKSEDMDFVFVREQSESPERKQTPPPPPRAPSDPPPVAEVESETEDLSLDKEENRKQISNKAARQAKRNAAAAKKREEVERRRKEKEEEVKRQREEADRQEQLKNEMEEERKRRDEERRLRKLQQEEERKKEEQAAVERERRKQLEQEREKRAKEEYQRKLEEMKKKQAEEEQRRMEAMLEKQREDEERRREEEEMLSQMAEQERLAYERKKQEEEEHRRQREEEEKKRREEEAQRALEEAKRLAEEMARRQAELEARLKFNRDLQLESHGLNHTQDITKMFVFSYFELLQWLGLDIPEFDLQKLAQF
ncbi:titin homolog isoform X1 [Haliotis rufescens]|uniref:titin homolog isoform X1 n=1 Tax=Haliotis rufescens TaxID=6454 RepID=UPI00201F4CB2|nr:titin homolog isoform X1 [Haliotis rufescens]